MHTLGCIFALLLGIFWLIASAAMNIYRVAFGPFKPKREKQDPTNRPNPNPQKPTRKIFEDNEGEYVDFVEIKD